MYKKIGEKDKKRKEGGRERKKSRCAAAGLVCTVCILYIPTHMTFFFSFLLPSPHNKAVNRPGKNMFSYYVRQYSNRSYRNIIHTFRVLPLLLIVRFIFKGERSKNPKQQQRDKHAERWLSQIKDSNPSPPPRTNETPPPHHHPFLLPGDNTRAPSIKRVASWSISRKNRSSLWLPVLLPSSTYSRRKKN